MTCGNKDLISGGREKARLFTLIVYDSNTVPGCAPDGDTYDDEVDEIFQDI